MDDVLEYDDMRYWQPTLIKRNENLYVVATNESLNTVLGDMQLSDDVDTFITLSKHGVSIGSEFYKDDPKLKFMCESVTNVEHWQMDSMIEWLKEMKCELVVLSGFSSINLAKKKLIDLLRDANLEFLDTAIVTRPIKDYKNPVLVKFKKNSDMLYSPDKVAKVIHLVNSNPVDVK